MPEKFIGRILRLHGYENFDHLFENNLLLTGTSDDLSPVAIAR